MPILVAIVAERATAKSLTDVILVLVLANTVLTDVIALILVVIFVLLLPILVANAAIFVPKSVPARVAALTIVNWFTV